MQDLSSEGGSREWLSRKFPDHAQWPRVQRMLRLGGVACILHGGIWAAFYASHHMAALAVVLGALVPVGIGCMAVAYRRDRAALMLIAHVLVVMTLFVSVVETPSAVAARSTHLFLLPIGVASFFLFRSEGAYLRWGFPALCLTGLVVLAILPTGLGGHLELLSDAARQLRHATNTVVAMALTGAVLAIFREDLSAQMGQYAALVRAVTQQELRVYLQPQVNGAGQVIGAEMLLRWDRPGHGIQSPAAFIPLAEETGLIHEIGLMVLERACLQLNTWATLPGVDRWVVSVNVSPLQLASDTFVEDVRAIVQRLGAPANRLRLEITESALASDLAQLAAKMQALREDGISWSLDDFGTGFSSLALLQALPLDELKIDQSFVRHIDADASQRELVRKIFEIAELLGLATVAEGVETEQQRKWLADMGCEVFQGYLYGRPASAEAFFTRHVAPLQASAA